MPIGTHYKTSQIQPGVIHFHGMVLIASGPVVDAANSVTPGVKVTRTNSGRYTMTFNDGFTVGHSAITFTQLVASTTITPLVYSAIVSGLVAGATSLDIEIKNLASSFADPFAGDGFCYDLVRTNSSVVVT